MKIGFAEVDEWEMPYIQKAISGHELVFDKQILNIDNVESFSECEAISIFVYSTLNTVLLEKMPKLRFITTRSMGFDHIDLDYCKKNKIVVSNVPTYGANTVAEHTFALLLALSRKIVPAVERTRRGNFELDGLRGFDLHGKTIGVVGIGHIGTEVVRIAKGFGMKVVAYARHPSEEMAKSMGITFLSLPELLAVSDIVTLHVPHNKDTHHLINSKNINKFKKGSILVNTSRGGLIETAAILYGINNGILGAVGLDVLEEECGVKEERQLLTGTFTTECDLRTQLFNHVLINKDNVLITPHNAFNSTEALQTILKVTIENIQNFIQHKPVNIVSPL